jgi:hypothetical protein
MSYELRYILYKTKFAPGLAEGQMVQHLDCVVTVRCRDLQGSVDASADDCNVHGAVTYKY